MTEVAALAELVNYADAEQRKAVDALRTSSQKLRVQYANPVDAFVGHGGCDDPEWMGGACLSREAFHPKSAGTTGYAQVMSGRLKEIGYTGS
ncbi:SGNH/GDSL hydrolase family protein [Streptomyces laurentii]|uniref:hypothetical protein n=1 Tax=Streptomyces laurentii TaxID=39478 RepID=UPI003682E48A